MTIGSGNSISAFDYNAIQGAVSNLLGANWYWQTPTTAQTASGRSFKSSDLVALRNDINKCRRHQTGSDFTPTELPPLVAGQPIRGADLAKYQSCANTINAAPLTAAAQNMTLTSALTVTRASTWGSNAGPTIGAEVQADFGSNNSMKAFFNTGGEIRCALSHPSTATSQDTAWANLLSTLAPITIRGGTANSSSATSILFGYGNLTTTYQTIFTATASATSYTANNVKINAKLNAGNTGIVVQVLLNDAHSNAFYDVVQGGTKATFSHLKSTVVMTGITTPTMTTITNF